MASEAAKAAARARAKAQLDALKAGKKSGLRPKLPLGELPKRISKEAKALRKDPVTLTGSSSNKQVSPSRAASAAGNQRAFAPASARTSYSPKPMSAAAKAKAKAAGKAKAAKPKPRGPKAGSSIVSKVVKRAKTTAREARDIPTAFGGIKDVLTNKGNTRPKGGKVNQLKSSIKNVASQVKETGKAAATGKKGRPAQKYQTSRGDDPAAFWTQPKRK